MKFARIILARIILARIVATLCLVGGFALDLPPFPAYAQTGGFNIPGSTVYRAPMFFSGGIPTLSSCGTSPALKTASNDSLGRVTQGGSTTVCTVTFSTTFSVAPECFVQDLTGVRASMTVATTTSTLAITGLTAGDVFSYACFFVGNNQ